MAGDIADWIGRRTTIIIGCVVFLIGTALQTASYGLGLIVAGRLVAGFGVGAVSAILILYMSEIAKFRPACATLRHFFNCIKDPVL